MKDSPVEPDGDDVVYDPATDILAGQTKRGTPIEVSLDKVYGARYKVHDYYKQIRIGVALAGLVAFYFGAQDIFDLQLASVPSPMAGLLT